MPELETLVRHIRLFGAVAILISAGTWALDLLDVVYICPYCRTERSVMGLLGIMLLLPNPGHWLSRYLGSVLGALGVVVGGMQNFKGWRQISEGTFSWNDYWVADPFLLSGVAIFIITAEVLLLYAAPAKPAGQVDEQRRPQRPPPPPAPTR